MSSKTLKFINYIKNYENIEIQEIYNLFRYNIKYRNNIIGIILCENNNDYIYLIFDVKCENIINGYYNTHFIKEWIKCIKHIKKQIVIAETIY